MAIHRRLIALTMSAASLIAAALLLQHRAADANHQQQNNPVAESKQPAPAAGTSETAQSETADNIYLDLTAAMKSAQRSEDRIRKNLQKPITVEFKDTPLTDAIAHLSDRCDIAIIIDANALSEEGIRLDEPGDVLTTTAVARCDNPGVDVGSVGIEHPHQERSIDRLNRDCRRRNAQSTTLRRQ